MCGIVGYTGPRQACGVLLGGLTRLEYRGYDSAGVAVVSDGEMALVRRVGKLENLKAAVAGDPVVGTAGIGHTRWATHGAPTEDNAHPHRDCSGRLAIVHNGIIENFAELRTELAAAGHAIRSETDTEVVAHLIEALYEGDLVAAVQKATARLHGSYAIAAVHLDHPDLLVAARKDSPLIIGLGDGENIVASDIPAVLEHTRRVAVLHDGQVAVVTPERVTVHDASGAEVEPEVMVVEWDLDAAEKGGYEDFMLKEIFEQPKALRETLRGRVGEDGRIQMSELQMSDEELAAIERVFIVACGTSYHAGLVAKLLIEQWARVPVEVDVSSEFRYRDPIVDRNTLVVAITQSGETADTLAGVREARERGARVFAVTNVVGSRVTREADGVIYTHAGPEIGVAATKTFTAQIAALSVLALRLAQARATLEPEQVASLWAELATVPDVVEAILADAQDIEACAREYTQAVSSLFLGRGMGVPVAMEGALKLKEISYIHAEAYPAGEMKHGPIALITPDVPVVVVATQGHTYEKVVSNIQEVRARGARVIAVATYGDEAIRSYAEHVLWIPQVSEALSAIPAAVPLQLLAYHIAKLRGCNVDQPRNLAKSVTVE
ncbi:glutamine--fructose-6-phosphate transaminase (isomerizing) [Coriobacteriia bacterium Es71-Z0120]|uniref:glutamine--fructose-6-phosphate transaminase (isomerizing) n=1 Tax=Parvivirga hydrogeniphila TaxID=2939460 RepID=UPI002260D0BE|nr:glutamine--fructose-6-phosphate transaminase (isomerizing) [Parvivirga hydrogeniphila]MCL4078572.1 glutamine--fructose-6-phosphate transaminase (isomerizing) [Parvivirga hydrogeniphila]